MSDVLNDFQLFIGYRDEDFLNSLKNFLPDKCKVSLTSSHNDIVNNLLELQPDLAVLDYYIPEIDILKLCEQMSGDYPSLNTVICVALKDLPIAKKKWRSRALDYIITPLEPLEFMEDVNKVIRYVLLEREREKLIKSKIEFKYDINNKIYELKNLLNMFSSSRDKEVFNSILKQTEYIDDIIKHY